MSGGTFTIEFRTAASRAGGWDVAEDKITTSEAAEAKAAQLLTETAGLVFRVIYEATDRELDAAAWVGDVLMRTAAHAEVRRTQNFSFQSDVPGDADAIALSGARPVVSIWALVAA